MEIVPLHTDIGHNHSRLRRTTRMCFIVCCISIAVAQTHAQTSTQTSAQTSQRTQTTEATPLRIVSWNIANLHHETDVALRSRAAARSASDYQALASIAANLNADIALLQEVGSLQAVARVFPASAYHLFISDRYTTGDESKSMEQRDIYTAVAISKDRFPTPPPVYTESAFSISHIDYHAKSATASSRPTRAAMVVELQQHARTVKLLNLHLKSSCHQYALKPVADQNKQSGQVYGSRFDCRTLKAQQLILENWIEVQHALGHGVIIGGDFNRRLNRVFENGNTDHFWQDLNDGEPGNLILHKGPVGPDTQCWPQHKRRFIEHIDFFVLDASIVTRYPAYTIEKKGLSHDNNPAYAGKRNQKLSDHCPVVLTLQP